MRQRAALRGLIGGRLAMGITAGTGRLFGQDSAGGEGWRRQYHAEFRTLAHVARGHAAGRLAGDGHHRWHGAPVLARTTILQGAQAGGVSDFFHL